MTTVSTSTRSRRLVRRVLASDLVDRLAAPHGVDRYLELVDPLWVVRETRAEVVDVVRQTAGTVTLTLRPTDAWGGFRAGQHVVVGVDIDGVIHDRCFSLAGSPNRVDGLLELTVKANPTGRVSRHLVDHARVGQVLRLSEAQGEFVLPAPTERTRHLVLISGGSGITPVISMLRALVDDGHPGPVTFVHYAFTAADVCYLEELRRLVDALPQGRLLLSLTAEPGAGDLDGFFGPEHLATITDDPAELDIYLCGPAPLMAAVEAHLAGLGLADRVHLERFGSAPLGGASTSASSARSSAATSVGVGPGSEGASTSASSSPSSAATSVGVEPAGSVTFSRSGVTAAAEATLLDTAEAAGLEPRFGCRRGICGTCTTTKTSGTVRNLVTGEASSPDREPIRLCVSQACGDVLVDL